MNWHIALCLSLGILEFLGKLPFPRRTLWPNLASSKWSVLLTAWGMGFRWGRLFSFSFFLLKFQSSSGHCDLLMLNSTDYLEFSTHGWKTWYKYKGLNSVTSIHKPSSSEWNYCPKTHQLSTLRTGVKLLSIKRKKLFSSSRSFPSPSNFERAP